MDARKVMKGLNGSRGRLKGLGHEAVSLLSRDAPMVGAQVSETISASFRRVLSRDNAVVAFTAYPQPIALLNSSRIRWCVRLKFRAACVSRSTRLPP
jgi:hypothetical protein